MAQEIITINLGGVNCYLLKTGGGCALIDTGMSASRARLFQKLENADCKPGDLKLVLLTHGDHDHAGSCKYLQEQYCIKIAMHRADSGMVEHGDMSWNRKAKPDKRAFFFKVLSAFAGKIDFDTFTPDIYLEDGESLAGYGFDATIVHLPGHSRGSIGILTSDGSLVCGDLLVNITKPGLHFMINDMAEAKASIDKIVSLGVKMVYPGHGRPFAMERFKGTGAL